MRELRKNNKSIREKTSLMMMYECFGKRLRDEWSMAKGNTKPSQARAESGRVYEILRVVRKTLLLSFVHWGFDLR